MFFIKLTFWLGLAVLLLPTDAQQQARLYTTAASAWATFLKKAEFGARLVGDMISSSGRQVPDASPAPKHNTGADAAPRGTLSSADMQPAWRGPSVRRTGT